MLMGYFVAHLTACNHTPDSQEPTTLPPKLNTVLKDSIPLSLQKLAAAYPEHKFELTSNSLIWEDGTEMIYQDSIASKSFEMLLNQPDLEDQMSMSYPKGKDYPIPSRNSDPGRIRFEPFFLKMYGASKDIVQKKLVSIDFLGQTLKVTTVNDIDKKLSQIAQELAQLPDLKPYLKNVGGTFNWRKIAGTDRMSTHSFGMTIDINVKYANYWRWAVADKTEDGKRLIQYKNRVPMELVEIFEKHGFIWGGKWYHYDTMHFEYRPELL